MSDKHTEIEIKVQVNDLVRLERRLNELDAVLVHPRQHEINLRFDRDDHSLAVNQQVLRLRQDDQARLTFKGPGIAQQGVRIRREIEFTVSDFDAARLLLEALGFKVYTVYEKFRTTFRYANCLVVLDELPYGNFCEIEGPDPDTIRSVNTALGLNWDAAVTPSYTDLFQRLRSVYNWPFQDLTFENFEALELDLKTIGVKSADQDQEV